MKLRQPLRRARRSTGADGGARRTGREIRDELRVKEVAFDDRPGVRSA